MGTPKAAVEKPKILNLFDESMNFSILKTKFYFEFAKLFFPDYPEILPWVHIFVLYRFSLRKCHHKINFEKNLMISLHYLGPSLIHHNIKKKNYLSWISS